MTATKTTLHGFKILRKYGPAAGIDRPLLKYRMSKTSKSGDKKKSAIMTYKVYRYMATATCAVFCILFPMPYMDSGNTADTVSF